MGVSGGKNIRDVDHINLEVDTEAKIIAKFKKASNGQKKIMITKLKTDAQESMSANKAKEAEIKRLNELVSELKKDSVAENGRLNEKVRFQAAALAEVKDRQVELQRDIEHREYVCEKKERETKKLNELQEQKRAAQEQLDTMERRKQELEEDWASMFGKKQHGVDELEREWTKIAMVMHDDKKKKDVMDDGAIAEILQSKADHFRKKHGRSRRVSRRLLSASTENFTFNEPSVHFSGAPRRLQANESAAHSIAIPKPYQALAFILTIFGFMQM